MWLIFLSRSTERQAGHEGKSVVPDSKKAELTNIFCTSNFFVFIFIKYEFFTYIFFLHIIFCMYLLLQTPFKRKFCLYFCEFDHNLQNLWKNIHAKISAFKVDILWIQIRWCHPSKIRNNILKTILTPSYRE